MHPACLAIIKSARHQIASQARSRRAVWLPRACFTINPGALTKAYAKLAQRNGGAFVPADASGLAKTADGWELATKQGTIRAAQIAARQGKRP